MVLKAKKNSLRSARNITFLPSLPLVVKVAAMSLHPFAMRCFTRRSEPLIRSNAAGRNKHKRQRLFKLPIISLGREFFSFQTLWVIAATCMRLWLEPNFRAFSFILSVNARNSGSTIEHRHLISMFLPYFLSKKSKQKTQKPVAGQLFPVFRFFDVLRKWKHRKKGSRSMGGLSQLADGSAMLCAPVSFVICSASLLPVGAAATADFDF